MNRKNQQPEPAEQIQREINTARASYNSTLAEKAQALQRIEDLDGRALALANRIQALEDALRLVQAKNG